MIKNTTLLCNSSLSKVPTTKTSLPFTSSSWKVEPQVLLISSLQLPNCKIIQLHDCKMVQLHLCCILYSSCWSPSCNCKSTTMEENLPVSKVCRPTHNDYQQFCPGTVNLKFIWRPYGKISATLFRGCLMGFARFWLKLTFGRTWKLLKPLLSAFFDIFTISLTGRSGPTENIGVETIVDNWYSKCYLCPKSDTCTPGRRTQRGSCPRGPLWTDTRRDCDVKRDENWENISKRKRLKIFRLTLKDIFLSCWSLCSHSEQQFGFQTKVRWKKGTRIEKKVPFLRNRSSFATALRIVLENRKNVK